MTRELSLLRQQTASVASTASSTSISLADHSTDALHSPYTASSSIYPTTSRRHRSSSSLSSHLPPAQVSRTGSVVGIAPLRDVAARTSLDAARPGQSRETSISSPRRSLEQQHYQQQQQKHPQQSDLSLPHSASHSQSTAQRATAHPNPHPYPAASLPAVSSPRLEELTHQREELEMVKRENEALRRRVRELELSLRESRAHQGPTSREHNSTVGAAGVDDAAALKTATANVPCP